MARMIRNYSLNCGNTAQAVDMPRRARVLYVAMGESGPVLFAEVLEDADTRAFDVKHLRHFHVVMSGGAIPEGAGYVGSCGFRSRAGMADYHIYELPSVKVNKT